MKDLYVCNTVFHSYLSLVKANYIYLHEHRKSDFIISDHFRNINPSELAKKVNEFEFISNVYVLNDYQIAKEIHSSKIKKYIMYKELVSTKIDRSLEATGISKNFRNYNNIFIFLPDAIFSHYLIYKKLDITLMEDGTGIYNEHSRFHMWMKVVLRHLKSYGLSAQIKTIEVISPEKLPLELYHKAKELKIDHMKEFIGSHLAIKILSVFLPKGFDTKVFLNVIDNGKKNFVLFTQSFSVFGSISKEYQIGLYRRFVHEFYDSEYNLIIKPHPSDEVDYSEIFTGAIIIPASIPAEVLDIFGLILNVCATINSTSLMNIDCNERIVPGVKYDKFLEERLLSHYKLKKINDNLHEK